MLALSLTRNPKGAPLPEADVLRDLAYERQRADSRLTDGRDGDWGPGMLGTGWGLPPLVWWGRQVIRLVGAVLICAGLAVVGLGAHTLADPQTPEVVATQWLITGLLAEILGVGILALAQRRPL